MSQEEAPETAWYPETIRLAAWIRAIAVVLGAVGGGLYLLATLADAPRG